jgi:hypothetical protein
LDDHLHAAVLDIVLDGVVAEVVNHLLQDLLIPLDGEVLAGGAELHRRRSASA